MSALVLLISGRNPESLAVRRGLGLHIARRRRIGDRRQCASTAGFGRSVRNVAQPLANAPVSASSARRVKRVRWRLAEVIRRTICRPAPEPRGRREFRPGRAQAARDGARLARLDRAVEAPAKKPSVVAIAAVSASPSALPETSGEIAPARIELRRGSRTPAPRHRAAMVRKAIEQQQRQRREIDADADRVQADRQHRPRHARLRQHERDDYIDRRRPSMIV